MDLDKTSKIHSLQFRNVNKWQKSVEKLGRWCLLHKWLDASSRYADKLAFPASKHY